MSDARRKPLIDRLLPSLGTQANEPETRFRAELALAFGLFQVSVSTLSCVSELAWGTPALGVLYAVGLIPIVAILIWLRQGGNPNSVGIALVAMVFALVTVTNLATGGRSYGANIALPTVALFAVLMSSRRAGLIWVALVVVEILVVAMLRRSSLHFPIRPNPDWVATAIDRVPLYFSLGSALIGWMALRAIEQYRSRLVDAREAESIARTLATRNAERFTDFAEVAADGFWETDSELRLTYVSKGFAHAMGLGVEEMLGLTPEQAYLLRHPTAQGMQTYMAPMRSRHPFQDQLLSTEDDAGNGRWLLNQGRPIFDVHGQFAGFRGAVRDVTEQKRAAKALKSSEERLRLITENVPALIAYLDHEERYRFCNSLVGQVLDVDVQGLMGRSMREVRGDAIYSALAGHVAQALRGEPVNFEGEGHWDGSLHHFQTSYVPDVAPDGRTMGFYAVTFDITKIKESEIALADATRRLRLIADNLPAAITHIDGDRRFTFNNETHAKWLGRSVAELKGQHVADAHTPEIYEQILPRIDAAFSGERTTFEVEGGSHHYRATYVPELDAQGKVVGVFGLVHDITKLKQIEGELRTLSQFDVLTGLANRRRYNERLGDAIARSERTGQAMGLMFLDLDRFKLINDSLGHRVGDQVLQEFARRVSDCVRRTDTVARLAGDEFVIILESLESAEAAETVARKIMRAMNEAVEVDCGSVQVSASIGVALRQPGETDGEALLRRADEALYAVKAKQRGNFRIASTGQANS